MRCRCEYTSAVAWLEERSPAPKNVMKTVLKLGTSSMVPLRVNLTSNSEPGERADAKPHVERDTSAKASPDGKESHKHTRARRKPLQAARALREGRRSVGAARCGRVQGGSRSADVGHHADSKACLWTSSHARFVFDPKPPRALGETAVARGTQVGVAEREPANGLAMGAARGSRLGVRPPHVAGARGRCLSRRDRRAVLGVRQRGDAPAPVGRVLRD
eukprot:7125002-Prymnesium_polylepis.2